MDINKIIEFKMAAAVKEEGSNQLPFLEHLHELRNRMLFTVVGFIILFFISYITAPYFIFYIKNSAKNYDIALNLFKITESITMYIKIMFIQALCFTTPILTCQIYLFAKPALSKSTRKKVIFLIPIISGLFILGSLLGLRLLVPLLMNFFINFSKALDINTIYSFSDYFNLVIAISFIIGLVLELPAILMFLTLIKLLNPSKLRKSRKWVYPVLCFIALMITPPDLISDIIVTVFLFVLYEISIIGSSIIYKRSFKQ
ncbi:twin-arginine translocase subunit TatC [Fictibacillus sp. NPDC058756]|uniref:twin-arginine translocase subunit TatC n=1 Tax=Fictibacillus sp. NPDC058756 TaxID=3346625 RepID=UPI0036B692D5